MRYDAISNYFNFFNGYTELRAQRNSQANITLLSGDIIRNYSSMVAGVSARIFKDGVWGFASSPSIQSESLKSVFSLATRNAQFLSTMVGKSNARLVQAHGSGDHDLSTSKLRLSRKELLDFTRTVDSKIAEAYPGLLSRTVSLRCLDMEKTLITSEGAEAYSYIPRAILFVRLTMSDRIGNPVDICQAFGGLGQFEDVFSTPEVLYKEFDRLHCHLVAKADGVYPKAGVQHVILGPELTGILAHEAIGHTVEGDGVLGGSIAREYLGKKVASDLVTLVDFAHTALDSTCPVPVWIDDEGTPAEDAVLIDKGVLTSFMHNKETATKLGAKPTGNARAFAFSDEPLVRMRNTAVLPGTSKLNDMIASIDDGYYLMRDSNGQSDSTSEFMFGVVLGYEIKDGKLGRAIKDTTVSGVAFDMLKTVTAVSDDMVWTCAGMCGKKQMIPVGMGGPAIKCSITIGGR